MSRAAGPFRATALLLAAVVAGLALVVGLRAPSPDVVARAPDVLVPLTSDQQVLAASAALDRLVEVTRDPDGRLVLVLPADVDPLALERDHPAPAADPPGSAWALGVAALLLVLTTARPVLGWAAAAAALAAAALTALGRRRGGAQAFSR